MKQPNHQDFDWNDIYTGSADDYMPPDPLVLEVTEGLTPGHVLDVGCGAGGLLAAFAQRGWKVHGIDIAEKAIRAARSVLDARGVEATLEVADATQWRPERTYDLIVSTFALPMDHAGQAAAYRMIRGAIAPGGHVVLEDFDPQMSRLAPFEGIDLVEVAHLVEAFDGFDVQRAEVVPTPAHDHHEGKLGEPSWTASLFVGAAPAVE